MTYKIIVEGKVQGVFFRDSTKEKADKLKIRGTVENLDNGTVKIIAQGKEKALDKLVEWCKIGTEKSEVKKVNFKVIPDSDFLKNFIVKRW